jgi:hypothetical protein
MEARFARASVVIGAGSVISAAFVFTPALPEFVDLVDVSGPLALVFVILGAMAIIGGVRRDLVICAIAGVGFLAAALTQLVQLATGVVILGGDASALALFGAWGAGLLCVCWADRNTPAEASLTRSPREEG